MKFRPCNVMLKNGTVATIRMARPADAQNLLETVTTYIGDAEFIPKEPSEITLTAESTAQWISDFQNKKNSLLLIAEQNGRILGNIDLTAGHRKAMHHTAVVGMGLLSQCRGIGLGTALLHAAVTWAEQNDELSLLWLQVYTANKVAIRLYRNSGFVEAGIIPGYFRHDESVFDNLTMYRHV